MGTRIEAINALAELERNEWPFIPTGEHEVKVRCPVHDDDSPSVQLNVKQNVWNCKACKAKGDIVTLLAHILKVERSIVLIDLSTRYDIEELKTINPKTVEKFHAAIKEAGPLLTALYARGLDDKDIRKHRIGFNTNVRRLAIPIYGLNGEVLNIRYYLPGAPGPKKMKNTSGYGSPRIYLPEQVEKYDTLWLLGGELKAIVAAKKLNKKGIGAFAVAASEGSWDIKFNAKIKGKVVYICMDIDNHGKAAAIKLAQTLQMIAKEIFIVHLPLDPEKYPKGDINDLIGQEGGTLKHLLEAMQSSKAFKSVAPTIEGNENESATQVQLSKVTNPKTIGAKLGFDCIVAAMDTTPFLVPKLVGVLCSRDQPLCHLCPISGIDPDPDTGYRFAEIPSNSPGILELVDSPTSRQADGIKVALNIPKCKLVTFSVQTHFSVRDTRLTPQLSIGSEGVHNVTQKALVLDKEDIELNTPYDMAGVVYPSPKDQQATLLVNFSTETEDNLASFNPSEEDLEALKIFQPREWSTEGIETKLADIYQDFASNVTRIFGRDEIHLTLDLTWHSCLAFMFDEKLVTGWINTLIIGDSSQGKSETATRLIEHYSLGERVVLKNATPAGIIGGLQQLGTRWFVSWGVIPTHDKRLVVLDEVKGSDVDLIGKLTDMRSSGIAELSKIEKRRAHARTRLAFISNPRSNRSISTYSFGIEAIKELIGSLEDIRRFDAAIMVAASQVDPEAINALHRDRPKVEHKYTAKLSNRLVLFGWTRKITEVSFTPDATRQVMERVIKLCEKFSEAMPLVDRGTMRHKLARMAVAIAVRTFSVSKDMRKVLVRKCHIDFIADFIDATYSDPIFGYLDFSRAQVKVKEIVDERTIRQEILSTRHPRDFVSQLIVQDTIALEDIADWTELELDDCRKIISLLVRKHCLYRRRREYLKTAEFIRLLKEMELEDLPEDAETFQKDEF